MPGQCDYGLSRHTLPEARAEAHEPPGALDPGLERLTAGPVLVSDVCLGPCASDVPGGHQLRFGGAAFE